jgi:hypothetical protein
MNVLKIKIRCNRGSPTAVPTLPLRFLCGNSSPRARYEKRAITFHATCCFYSFICHLFFDSVKRKEKENLGEDLRSVIEIGMNNKISRVDTLYYCT